MPTNTLISPVLVAKPRPRTASLFNKVSANANPPFASDQWTLPCEDDVPVKNFFEHPQTSILSNCAMVLFRLIHPDRKYIIGQDCGIYWNRSPSLVVVPDWFYVPGVFPYYDQEELPRRSYIFYEDQIPPTIVLEIASDNGGEERDETPYIPHDDPKQMQRPGKKWVYEHILKVPNYFIYVVKTAQLECHRLTPEGYVQAPADENGRYLIPELNVRMGLWHGEAFDQVNRWVRLWDAQGNLIPLDRELYELERARADQEKKRADEEKKRADEEKERADREKKRADELDAYNRALTQKLRDAGIELPPIPNPASSAALS